MTTFEIRSYSNATFDEETGWTLGGEMSVLGTFEAEYPAAARAAAKDALAAVGIEIRGTFNTIEATAGYHIAGQGQTLNGKPGRVVVITVPA